MWNFGPQKNKIRFNNHSPVQKWSLMKKSVFGRVNFLVSFSLDLTAKYSSNKKGRVLVRANPVPALLLEIRRGRLAVHCQWVSVRARALGEFWQKCRPPRSPQSPSTRWQGLALRRSSLTSCPSPRHLEPLRGARSVRVSCHGGLWGEARWMMWWSFRGLRDDGGQPQVGGSGRTRRQHSQSGPEPPPPKRVPASAVRLAHFSVRNIPVGHWPGG